MLELASWGVACRDGPPTPASGRRTQSSRVSGTLRQIEGLEYESTIHPDPPGVQSVRRARVSRISVAHFSGVKAKRSAQPTLCLLTHADDGRDWERPDDANQNSGTVEPD
jgi:hypothetical protein